MKIGIIGTGYVGLTQGVVFSNLGKNVICMDISEEKVNTLKKGSLSIYEPGLRELMLKSIKAKTLDFTTDIKKTVENCEVIFIAVGTPSQEDGSSNLHYVMDVAKEIGTYINDYKVIVDKSTVPVGTGKKVKEVIKKMMKERNVDFEFDMVSNPEFIREGKAIRDCTTPDRIVIGTENERAKKIMKKIYGVFIDNQIPFIFTNIETAEMIKYAANSMLATRISFMNDIANLCELVGADVNMVRKGIGADTRIGNKFLYPGCGYGGSCFPKDVKALIKTAEKNGYEMRVLKAVEEVNEAQKSILFKKLSKHFNNELSGKRIAIWGLAFKPETDDMREATSLVMIKKLIESGCKVRVYDPVAMDECKRRIGDVVEYATDMYDAVLNADSLLLLTEWKQFRMPSWGVLKKSMNQAVLIDGRNIYDKQEVEEAGFSYMCIGK